MNYILEYENGIDFARHLDGIAWYEAPPPRKRHKHIAQTQAMFNGDYIERCACGAFGPAPWFYLAPDSPRLRASDRLATFMALLAQSPLTRESRDS